VDTAAAFSISPDELRALLGRADAPLLLDVRRPPKFRASDRMLPGALYCAPEAVAEFAAARAPRDVVTYCVYGHEVSHVAAQVLRDAGWNARWLAGGIEGGEPGVDAEEAIAGWRAHPLPTVPKRPDTEPSA
jgi:rhodanese-related sulfurtransferase